MTVSQRVRMCRMVEAIRTDKEYADRIQVEDRSHFRIVEGIQTEGDQYSNARSGTENIL